MSIFQNGVPVGPATTPVVPSSAAANAAPTKAQVQNRVTTCQIVGKVAVGVASTVIAKSNEAFVNFLSCGDKCMIPASVGFLAVHPVGSPAVALAAGLSLSVPRSSNASFFPDGILKGVIQESAGLTVATMLSDLSDKAINDNPHMVPNFIPLGLAKVAAGTTIGVVGQYAGALLLGAAAPTLGTAVAVGATAYVTKRVIQATVSIICSCARRALS